MRSLLLLAALVAAICGDDDLFWADFRASKPLEGTAQLPTTPHEAEKQGWKKEEDDAELNVKWYSQAKDPRVLIAFDQRDTLAAVRVAFLEKDVDQKRIASYKNNGVFEKKTIHGQPVYVATVLFTNDRTLKKGGRRKSTWDEVVLGVNLRRGPQYLKLLRDGCDQLQDHATEQGCLPGYGMILSKFSSSTPCDSFPPFYGIYDTKGRGNLIGFGLLSFGSFHESDFKTTTYYHNYSGDTFKRLFPKAPECLAQAAEKGVVAVEVIFVKPDISSDISCETGKWSDEHCAYKLEKKAGK